MKTIINKIALVTGGSRGIGRAASVELAKAGYYVIVHYRADEQAAQTTLQAVRDVGSNGFTVSANLAAADGVSQLFGAVDAGLAEQSAAPHIDVLLNNAGVAEGGAIDSTTADLFDRQFALNVKAVFFTTQEALKRMGTDGRIINVSSVLSSRVFETLGGFNALSAYAASKAAVDALTRHWAVELGSRGIVVNAVAPGPVDTDMNAGWLRTEEGRAQMTAASPLGRVGTPQDVASVIGFLASPASRWTTGQVIDASGGYRL